MFFDNIFLNRETKEKKRKILAAAKKTAEKIIEEAEKKRKKIRKKRKKELMELRIEIEEKKKEIDLLKNKLRKIEKLLEGTKLADFLDYLREIRKELIGLKEMFTSLESNTSFSTRIASEERIITRILALLNKTERVKRKIKVDWLDKRKKV